MSDGVGDLAAVARGQSLLGLDRGVQAVGPALPPGHPALDSLTRCTAPSRTM